MNRIIIGRKLKGEVDLRDVDGFIQKPFENKELIAQIKSAMDKFGSTKKHKN